MHGKQKLIKKTRGRGTGSEVRLEAATAAAKVSPKPVKSSYAPLTSSISSMVRFDKIASGSIAGSCGAAGGRSPPS